MNLWYLFYFVNIKRSKNITKIALSKQYFNFIIIVLTSRHWFCTNLVCTYSGCSTESYNWKHSRYYYNAMNNLLIDLCSTSKSYLRSILIEEANRDDQDGYQEGGPHSFPYFRNVAIKISPSRQTCFVAELCKTVFVCLCHYCCKLFIQILGYMINETFSL